MKKKITAVALAVCILVVGIVGATMSYFTDKDTATNTFTFGKVDITLTEDSTADPTNGVLAGTPKADGKGYTYDKVLPGQVYSKIPTVKVASDSLEAYVVVTATVPAAYDYDGLLGGVVAPSVAKVEHYVNAATGNNTYVFYYLQPVTAGNSVTPFNTVTVNPALTKDVMGQTFDVVVNAYAIQTDGFTKVEDAFNAAFGSAREAFGVPFKIQDFSTTATVTRDANGKAEEKVVTNPDNTIKVTIPSDAIEDDVTEVKVTITPKSAPAMGVTVDTATETVASYEIKVEGLKEGNTTKLPVSFYVGKDLASVKVYHDGVLIGDAQYDAATGYVSFETANFSPFDVVYSAPTATITTAGKDVHYGTLAEAVAAAKNGDTIVLRKDVTGSGIGTYKNAGEGQIGVKSFTIDFDGHTYTVSEPPVGSKGYETQAFHLEWNGNAENNVKVTLQNGTLTSTGSAVKMMIQNYCDLTLDNMVIDGTNYASKYYPNGDYVVSNNCGNVTIKDTTIIARTGDFAFDSCKYGSYNAPTVAVSNSVIYGRVEKTGGEISFTNSTVVWDGVSTDAPCAAEGDTYEIYSAAQLAGFAKAVNEGNAYNGKTVKLVADIDLNNVEWTQINGAGKNIVFDGNEKTISNLKISDGHNAGFFCTGSGCTIKNLTVDGATVKGVGRIAVICGHGMCVKVENCTVKNATVTAVVTNNDDGDKAGAIVGYLSGESTAYVKNCKAEKCQIKGYRDVGALVGYAGGTYEVSSSSAKDCTVTCDKSNNYKNYTDAAQFDVNELVGEKTNGTFEKNTATNVTVVK